MGNWLKELFSSKKEGGESTSEGVKFQKEHHVADWLKEVVAEDKLQKYIDLVGDRLEHHDKTPEGELDKIIDDLSKEKKETLTVEERSNIYKAFGNDSRILRESSLSKEAAYEVGETREETIEQDFERDIKILSDEALAEKIAELELQKSNEVSTRWSTEYPKILAEVTKNRKNAEKRLRKLIPDHARLDIMKFFSEMEKDVKIKKPKKEKDIVLTPQAWNDSEDKFKVKKGVVASEVKHRHSCSTCKNYNQTASSLEASCTISSKIIEAHGKIAYDSWVGKPNDTNECNFFAGVESAVTDSVTAIPEETTVEKQAFDAAVELLTNHTESYAARKIAKQFNLSNQVRGELRQILKSAAKIKEVPSPWRVVKGKEGKDVIVRYKDIPKEFQKKEASLKKEAGMYELSSPSLGKYEAVVIEDPLLEKGSKIRFESKAELMEWLSNKKNEKENKIMAENLVPGKTPIQITTSLKVADFGDEHGIKEEEPLQENQIKLGIEVEKEHADTVKKIKESVKDNQVTLTDEEIYKSIAEDHLKENKSYYTYLAEMEQKMQVGQKEKKEEPEIIIPSTEASS